MSDSDLTATEQDLAQAALDVSTMIETRANHDNDYWCEDLIPPDTEDDVLGSTLRTPAGDPAPKAGFTLWRGNRPYDVTIEPHPTDPATPWQAAHWAEATTNEA
jgi:hypothetical protein